MEQESYYTVKDVMRITGYSLRNVDRYCEKGIFVVLNPGGNPRKISRASVDAFNEANGPRPLDEVDVLKQELLEQKQATGDALRQLAALRARLEDLEHLVKRQFAEIETWFRAQHGRRSRGPSPADPDGAISLVEFARRHNIQRYGKLRGLAEREPTLVTVILRPNATEKPHKWMITPGQMDPLLSVLEEHGIAWQPCDGCPHAAQEHQAPQEEHDRLQLAQ